MMLNRLLKPLMLLGLPVITSIVTAEAASDSNAQAWPFSGHSAWVYDTHNVPGEPRTVSPGFFSAEIARYNRNADPGHKISTIYSYHGSMEMYCSKHDPKHCPPDKLILSLATETSAANHHQRSSVAHYRQTLGASDKLPEGVGSVAIIDGVVNGHYEGSLKGFNELSQEAANAFAEKVAAALCKDPNIEGVQFDLEPLDVRKKNGQYFFYKRIAALFAQDNGPCIDENHPQGRYFSVFAPVHSLKANSQSAKNLQAIFSAHQNGYLIAPIYDLDATPLGHSTSVKHYRKLAQRQLDMLNRWSKQAEVPFKIGIPAAASVHEYVDCKGPPCKKKTPLPTSQLDYVQAVFTAMAETKIRDNPFFLGNAVWAWSRGISHGGASFHPQKPSDNMQDLLGRQL
jgi:hypothetical protein